MPSRAGGQRHVQSLRECRGSGHGGDWIDAREHTIHERESGGRVHPRIRDDDEDPRRGAAHGDKHAREQMRARRHSLPTVQVDAEEDRLGEKGESLERERHPDDGTRQFHEARPEQAELEGKDRPRDGADGEQNRGAARPPLGELQIDGIAGALPAALREHHEHRHGDPDDGKNDVKRERHRHLGPGGEEVAHANAQ